MGTIVIQQLDTEAMEYEEIGRVKDGVPQNDELLKIMPEDDWDEDDERLLSLFNGPMVVAVQIDD